MLFQYKSHIGLSVIILLEIFFLLFVKDEKVKKIKENLFIFLFWGILLLLISKLMIYHYNIITNPYPSEYREGALIETTNMLLNGENPYSIENQPHTNVYGILYSIACYPFAKIFGSTLLIHRAISGLFIFLSCFVVFLFAKRRKLPLIFTCLLSLILYGTLLYFITPLSRPDSLGLFMFLLALYIPYKYDYSYKSLMISIILGILAFFTKSFFLLLFPYLCSYIFLFNSKKKGLIYLFLSTALTVPTILFLNSFMETYVTNTFFNHINFSSWQPCNINYFLKQMLFFIKSNFGIFVIALLSLIIVIFEMKKEIKSSVINFKLTGFISNRINFNKPLFKYNLHCIFFYLFCSAIILSLTNTGRHTGAWMTYFYQLLSPFLVLTVLEMIKKTYKQYVFFFVFGALNIYFLTYNILPQHDTERNKNNWKKINNIIKGNNNILNSPTIAPLMQKNKINVYDCGQSEYYPFSYTPKFFGFLPFFHNIDKLTTARLNSLNDNIINSVKNKNFDLIIFPNYYKNILPDSFLSKYYHYDLTIKVSMYQTGQSFDLLIWKPN
ncbi:MAG: hypothetical protein PHD97_03055 [Bacteroidales bacterium]|nr:hypothetical protein [Bacteroidales bacterium]